MRGPCHRLALLAFLCCSFVFFTAPAAAASVLAIDYGADYMKASLMKPGLPFDVLLNRDSKRKIHSSVAWKNGERLFGQDAYNLATRFPKDTFNSLKYLLGVPANADIVSYYTTISTSTLVASSRFTAGIPKPGGRTWDVEELVAAQLAYIRQLATEAAGEPVRDVVVTVPPFYSQFERDAIVDAVEIAGMKLITLVSDGAAVALNFAMSRSFSEPEHHIIFDAGGSSTRATVVTISQNAKGRSTHVQVKGVGWDRIVSGTELTRRLREILIFDFQRKNGRDLRQDKKAMARLWKEADRVKGILSANTEAVSSVESLIDDIDFKTKVTRAQFEDKCKDIQGSFTQPLYEALANANLTMDDIKSVILFGGNSRVPMMRKALDAAAGEDKIAVNVNADEAAVLGAALYGAGLSGQFRAKELKLVDTLPYDVQVAYLSEKGDGAKRTIHSSAFVAGSKTGTRKTMSFKRHDDFNLSFQYKRPVAPEFPIEFLDARIDGVAEALANITAEGGLDPVIKATISLSESGFITVPEAFAYAEAKDDSITGKLKSLFGDKGPDSTGPIDDAVINETIQAVKALSKSFKVPLNVSVKYPTVAPMSLEQKRESRNRLMEQEAKEAAVAAREEQRNALESYIYRMRDLLRGDSQQPFMKCSQDGERAKIKELLDEVARWFSENEDTAETKDFVEKRTSLQLLEQPIQHRYQEIEEFPQALNNSQKWNFHTRLFLGDAYQNLTEQEKSGEEGKYTRKELEELEKTLKVHEAWLQENVEKQRAVKMNENPAIETKEMRERAKVLELHLQRLVQKKPPRKKTTTSSGASTSQSPSAVPPDTSTAETASKAEGKQPAHEEL